MVQATARRCAIRHPDRAGAGNDFACDVIAQVLAGARNHIQTFAAYRPKHEGLIIAAVKHARAVECYVPRVRRADGRRGRAPIPAIEHIDERVSLGQGRQFGLQAEQTAQFAAIGHAPVALAETLFAIHVRDEIRGFLPGEREFCEIGVSAPD